MPRGRLNLATWRKSLLERAAAREYLAEDLRCVAMPLGGIGTGSIALCGDGSLRQWQVVNQVNHSGYVPNSFFAVWTRTPGGHPVSRALQSARFLDDEGFVPAESVSDHVVPAAMRRWAEALPLIGDTRFRGEYPIARLDYDDDLPVEVSLDAVSPFVPFDAEASGVPAILFEFRVRNRTKARVQAALAASLQNFVGWDGVGLIHEVQNPGYGGNQNRLHRIPERHTLEMGNSNLPGDHPSWGEVGLACFADGVTACPQWDDLEFMWQEFQRDGRFSDIADTIPSSRWRTWNGSLSSRFDLEPGAEQRVTFAIAWYFPNRYVNWRQPGRAVEGEERSRFWLGNRYNRFGGVMPVLRHVYDQRLEIWEQARRFRDTMYEASQPYWFLDAVGANIAPARTNVCLQTEKGEFYGFEGGCGASTDWSEVGGCCALNCTHVWNYAMTVSRLWPELERSMRRTDWLVNQHADGYLPHRTPLPEYLPRLWEMEIGGPPNPALDGLFGGVLKTYREYLACGETAFLTTMAPHCFQALDYAMATCDTDGDGVIKGEQPNTYDIHIYGPNTFIGSLYLAALLAGERMALRMGERERAARYRGRFELGSRGYDETCWNGEYYRQVVDLEQHPKYQFGDGCMADQLLGQWWAHLLGLGYVLPREHVVGALRSVFKYNFVDGFENLRQEPRVFASPHDRGLLNASYPHGGRPDVPLLYSDEVWTGIEYQVAALMLCEGLTEEGLAVAKGVRDRYDGFERNPWNEVECGDHYVRSMSSWSLLDLTSGLVYDCAEGALRLGPTWREDGFVGFFVAGKAYGLVRHEVSEARIALRIEVAEGELELESVLLASGAAQGEANWAGSALNATFSRGPFGVEVRLPMRIMLTPNSPLEITLRAAEAS